MILRLAIEQARSQRRYTAWTAALMTLALSFIAFALLMVAMQRAVWDDVARVSLMDRTHTGGYTEIFGEVPELDDTYYVDADLLSVEDTDRRLAEAIAGGSDVAAVRSWAVVTRPATTQIQFPLAATTGAYDWDLVVAEGRLPGDGEILLNARIADELDLGIGDTIDLLYHLHPPSAEEPATEADWHPYTISGLSRGCDYNNPLLANAFYCPDYSYVSWDASTSSEGPLACHSCSINADGDTASLTFIQIAWNTGHPAIEGLCSWEITPWEADYEGVSSWWRSDVPPVSLVGYGLAGLIVVGMLLAALAVGRSQAQAQIKWVATARTLGATRRAIVGATLLESLLVAAAAAVASLTVGYGLATLTSAWMGGFRGASIGPSLVPMPLWVVAAVVLGGAILSLIVAVVPAFWASRVSPVAAFKPVTDVTEEDLSRRVSLWWVGPVFVGGLAAIWLGTREPGTVTFVGYIGAIVAGTTGFVLLKEGLGALVAVVGRRFTRSRSPVLQVTGDGFVSSPRNPVTLALLFALPAAVLAALMVVSNFSDLGSHLAAGLPSSTWPLPSQVPVGVWETEGIVWAFIILAEFEFVALAITVVSRWAAAGDAATRRALGLSTLQQRQAAFVRHVVPQIGGAIVGALIGFVFGLAAHLLTGINGANAHAGAAGDYLPAWGSSTLNAGYGVVLVAAFAGLGGLLVAAATSRVRPPVEALKPTGKARAR